MGDLPRAVPPRPLPRLRGLTREFYQWLGEGELRFQRCRRCGAVRHLPRELCPQCASPDWEWVRSSGLGRVFTWTTVMRPMHPAFADTPFTVAVVEMEEGPRVMGRLVGVGPEDVKFEMAVRVTFDRITDELALPEFQPVG